MLIKYHIYLAKITPCNNGLNQILLLKSNKTELKYLKKFQIKYRRTKHKVD